MLMPRTPYGLRITVPEKRNTLIQSHFKPCILCDKLFNKVFNKKPMRTYPFLHHRYRPSGRCDPACRHSYAPGYDVNRPCHHGTNVLATWTPYQDGRFGRVDLRAHVARYFTIE